MDRSEISRTLAKCLAYANCRKREEAYKWLETLITMLKAAIEEK